MNPPHGSSSADALSFAGNGAGSRQYVSSSNATTRVHGGAARASASRVGLRSGGPRASGYAGHCHWGLALGHCALCAPARPRGGDHGTRDCFFHNKC